MFGMLKENISVVALFKILDTSREEDAVNVFTDDMYRLVRPQVRSASEDFVKAASGFLDMAQRFQKDSSKPAFGASVVLIDCAKKIAQQHELDIRAVMQLLIHHVASNNIMYQPFADLKEKVEISFEEAADYLRDGIADLSSESSNKPPHAIYFGMHEACEEIKPDLI